MQKASRVSKLFGLSVIAGGLLLLLPIAASATPALLTTTIMFDDSTDSLGLGAVGVTGSPGVANGSCTGETCSFDVLVPTGGAGSGINSGLPLDILEPGGSVISDILSMSGFSPSLDGVGGYIVTFQSDTDETAGLGTFVSGTSITENGNVQTGFTITWNNVDGTPIASAVIQFQSDLDSTTSVPEPATLALFGAGLLGLGATRRRKKRDA